MLTTKPIKLLMIFCMSLFFMQANAARSVTVFANINGMTCQFCAYGLQKALKKVPQIQKARVSLARKQAKIILKTGYKLTPSLTNSIKQAIAQAGYTPGNVKASR
jgi:copper chaperone CopZ